MDTWTKSYFKNSNTKAGYASEVAVTKKHKLYEEIKRNYIFVAFAVETIGPWAKETQESIKILGKKLNETSGDKRSRNFFIQRLSLAIQRGNYECISGSLPSTDIR